MENGHCFQQMVLDTGGLKNVCASPLTLSLSQEVELNSSPICYKGIPGSSDGKESAYYEEDLGSVLGVTYSKRMKYKKEK